MEFYNCRGEMNKNFTVIVNPETHSQFIRHIEAPNMGMAIRWIFTDEFVTNIFRDKANQENTDKWSRFEVSTDSGSYDVVVRLNQ